MPDDGSILEGARVWEIPRYRGALIMARRIGHGVGKLMALGIAGVLGTIAIVPVAVISIWVVELGPWLWVPPVAAIAGTLIFHRSSQ